MRGWGLTGLTPPPASLSHQPWRIGESLAFEQSRHQLVPTSPWVAHLLSRPAHASLGHLSCVSLHKRPTHPLYTHPARGVRALPEGCTIVFRVNANTDQNPEETSTRRGCSTQRQEAQDSFSSQLKGTRAPVPSPVPRGYAPGLSNAYNLRGSYYFCQMRKQRLERLDLNPCLAA